MLPRSLVLMFKEGEWRGVEKMRTVEVAVCASDEMTCKHHEAYFSRGEERPGDA